MTVHWRCLVCDDHGESRGTESSADVKHMRATGHAVMTTTRAEWASLGVRR